MQVNFQASKNPVIQSPFWIMVATQARYMTQNVLLGKLELTLYDWRQHCQSMSY